MFKCITFAYPTSDFAEKHGHGKTGCYSVTMYTNSIERVLEYGPWPTWRQAHSKARKLAEPWHRFSITPKTPDDAQLMVDGLREDAEGRCPRDDEWKQLHAAEAVLAQYGRLQTATYNED